MSGSDLYAGGSFATAGGSAANLVAKWNGNNWSALGSGVSGPEGVPYHGGRVLALALSGSDLYAGGSFTTAGGSAANQIARWNGNSWSALGSGMNDTVYALAVSGSNLYAGGSFTTAGGNVANRIAKWNGSSWSALGSGMNDIVLALAASGSDLYAGGYFTKATNAGNVAVDVNYIAKWNSSSWSALGSGMFTPGYATPVRALAVSGGDLYAGGSFNTAGGVTVNNIAKWNGNTWSALGSGMGAVHPVTTAVVYALAVSGDELYAGGYFNRAGGTTTSHIAKWNGSTWAVLGLGMGGSTYPHVFALSVSGTNLYAGGRFTSAGGKVSPYVAKANIFPNFSPTNILLSNDSLAENQPAGTTVGILAAQDPDNGDTANYTLVAGTGNTDNASFSSLWPETAGFLNVLG